MPYFDLPATPSAHGSLITWFIHKACAPVLVTLRDLTSIIDILFRNQSASPGVLADKLFLISFSISWDSIWGHHVLNMPLPDLHNILHRVVTGDSLSILFSKINVELEYSIWYVYICTGAYKEFRQVGGVIDILEVTRLCAICFSFSEFRHLPT